jgi:hypothetical protein
MLRYPPPFVLNAQLADMKGTWLALACCKGVTYVPLKLLAGAAHPTARLRDVLRRMRCKDCHDRPASVLLVEDPAATGHGGPPAGWVIKLL